MGVRGGLGRSLAGRRQGLIRTGWMRYRHHHLAGRPEDDDGSPDPAAHQGQHSSHLAGESGRAGSLHREDVGLFGSFAGGQQSADSDIDLLVEFARPTYDNFAGLTDELVRLFGRRVEIMTPDGLDSIRVPRVAEGIRKTFAYG